MAGIAICCGLAALLLLGVVSQASASVTLGQLAPQSPPPANCANPMDFDVLQPTVTSGNTYVVPAEGTITEWRHNAAPDLGQSLTFKVFRLVSGTTYSVVAHNGPRAIAPSTINVFGGFSIPVKQGDVIGLNDGPPSACAFSTPGDRILELSGNLPDGVSGAFNSRPNVRVNVTAVFNPTNTFTLGAVLLNKKRGAATVAATVPNPGELTVSGKGVKSASAAGARAAASVPAAGTVVLSIRAQGKKKKKLNENGKVTVTPAITYKPTGGDARTLSVKVKLKKK